MILIIPFGLCALLLFDTTYSAQTTVYVVGVSAQDIAIRELRTDPVLDVQPITIANRPVLRNTYRFIESQNKTQNSLGRNSRQFLAKNIYNHMKN